MGPLGQALKWQTPRNTLVLQPYHWPLAASAFYSWRYAETWDSVAFGSQSMAQGILNDDDWWGIHSRRELLETLWWLLSRGQRLEYQERLSYWKSLSRDELTDEYGRYDPSVAAGRANRWRIDLVRNNTYGVARVKFSAWDLLRFIWLTRMGVSAGYLSSEEAVDFMVLPALQLRADYHSWEHMSWDFAMGRMWWTAGLNLADAESDYQQAIKGGKVLAGRLKGVWSLLEWRAPLVRSQWWFAQALAQEKIIAPLAPTHRAQADQWPWLLDTVLSQAQAR